MWNLFSSTPSVLYKEIPTPKTKEDFIKIIKEKENLLLTIIEENNDWKSIEFLESNNPSSIKCYSKLTSDSSIECLKAVGIIEGVDPKNFFEYVTNTEIEQRKTWEKDLIFLKNLENIDENIKVYWAAYNTPYPVTNRDFITVSKNSSLENGGYIGLATSINYDKVEINNDFVRGVSIITGWVILPIEGNNLSCKVYRVLQIDPKGWIPSSVTNSLKTRPAINIVDIRKILTGK